MIFDATDDGVVAVVTVDGTPVLYVAPAPAAPSDVSHPSRAAYGRGCRCPGCREENRIYMAIYRDNRRRRR